MWSGDMKDIFIIVFATLSFCFAGSYILVLSQSIKLKRDVSKLFIEKTLLQEYVESTKSMIDEKNFQDSVHKENFIKFLSDSRDWAYKYIEDVQEGLTTFVNGIEPEISYFDEYGEVGSAYPHYYSMKKISQEYKELKKLLPIEDEQ
jgi:hypothetical protein